MSAQAFQTDWRFLRAAYAVNESARTKLPIFYSHYYEVFDMDEEELHELFDRVALAANVFVQVLPSDPTAH
jgi:hypothetical protein